MRSQVLLFDLDGTLTDNYAGIAASIRHALMRLGAAEPSDEHLRGCVGPPLRGTFARLLETVERDVIERAIAHYRERFAELGWRENVAYPGIEEALRALRTAGARLMVCTAKPQVYAERIVAHFGFDAHMAAVYGADLAGELDDKGKLIAHLLTREAIDPADATMIGDRAHDIRAAHANRLRAVGVLWGYGTAEELCAADALVRTPAELPGAVLRPPQSSA